MSDFKLIHTQEYYATITKDFSLSVTIASEGVYAVVVRARASSWWQRIPQFLKRYFQDDHLSVNLDSTNELAWNGNDLKGLEQINIFFTQLSPGNQGISFRVKQQPTLLSVAIYEVANTENPNLVEVIPLSIEDGNRHPLVKLMTADGLAQSITVEATVLVGKQHAVFFQDDDDLKAVIDSEIVRNDLPKSHRDWYWCGQAQNHQSIARRTLIKELSDEKQHIIELYADRTPTIHRFELALSAGNAPPVFNEQYVIDDEAFTTVELTKKEIDDFLNVKSNTNPTHLAFRTFSGKRPAEIIYQSAKDNGINPKILLTKLQTEQGLITGDKSVRPTLSQMDSAMGVGIFDDGSVLQQYQGFVKQVHGAAAILRKHFDQAEKERFTVPDVDGRTLVVKSSATYSLYRYTPHLAGAKLFFDIYHKFFNQ